MAHFDAGTAGIAAVGVGAAITAADRYPDIGADAGLGTFADGATGHRIMLITVFTGHLAVCWAVSVTLWWRIAFTGVAALLVFLVAMAAMQEAGCGRALRRLVALTNLAAINIPGKSIFTMKVTEYRLAAVHASADLATFLILLVAIWAVEITSDRWTEARPKDPPHRLAGIAEHPGDSELPPVLPEMAILSWWRELTQGTHPEGPAITATRKCNHGGPEGRPVEIGIIEYHPDFGVHHVELAGIVYLGSLRAGRHLEGR